MGGLPKGSKRYRIAESEQLPVVEAGPSEPGQERFATLLKFPLHWSQEIELGARLLYIKMKDGVDQAGLARAKQDL